MNVAELEGNSCSQHHCILSKHARQKSMVYGIRTSLPKSCGERKRKPCDFHQNPFIGTHDTVRNNRHRRRHGFQRQKVDWDVNVCVTTGDVSMTVANREEAWWPLLSVPRPSRWAAARGAGDSTTTLLFAWVSRTFLPSYRRHARGTCLLPRKALHEIERFATR